VQAAVDLLRDLAARALAENRSVLMEHEVYSVLREAGLPVPEHALVAPGGAVPASMRGAVVVKIASPDILHKSDVGGVRFVDDAAAVTPDALGVFVRAASAAFETKEKKAPDVRGALVMRRVAFDAARLGAEVIAGLRWSRDFGFVGMIGLGGVKTEVFGSRLPRAEANAIFDPLRPDDAMREVRATLAYADLAGNLRGSTRIVDDEAWHRLLLLFEAISRALAPVGAAGNPAILELEMNPLVADGTGVLVPVDALARLRRAVAAPPLRPLHKLEKLFRPRTVAVAGVSAKGVNMGRIILRNLLRDGFPPERLYVLKPGDETVDGVRCTARLPERVDIAVLAVAAPAVPDLVDALAGEDRAETIIVVPGGMAEKEGGASLQKRIEDSVARSRSRPGGGPLVCGPNSMGVACAVHPLDTTFIPEHKLPRPAGAPGNLAFVSQSGAFTITRMSHLARLAPRYLVSAGNQMDLAVSDYVSFVARDPEVRTIAVYVEGFQPGDGARFLDAARAAVKDGRTVVLYKGGRSPEGRGTAAGHTASIAGDYRTAWHLARAAGVPVAESFGEFDALVKTACTMAGRPVRGRRVALVSNAGFEAVGMADNLRGEGRGLALAKPAPGTLQRIRAALARERVDALVDVRNPMDLTPSATDALHVEVARAFLADPGVDALVVGAVPMSPAMATLAHAENPAERLANPASVAHGWPALLRETDKPVVAVVDAGSLFDPLVEALEAGGLPVFRAADEAVRALGAYVEARLAAQRVESA